MGVHDGTHTKGPPWDQDVHGDSSMGKLNHFKDIHCTFESLVLGGG